MYGKLKIVFPSSMITDYPVSATEGRFSHKCTEGMVSGEGKKAISVSFK